MPLTGRSHQQYLPLEQEDDDALGGDGGECMAEKQPIMPSTGDASLSAPMLSDGLDESTLQFKDGPRDLRGTHGEKLLPNVRQTDSVRVALQWGVLGSIAAIEFGALTLGYDILTVADAQNAQEQQNAEAAAAGEEAVDGVVEQQEADNAQQNFGHEKAKLCMIIGAVVLVLCIIIAGVRGDLQDFLSRMCGRGCKCSRTLGHLITLVYITVTVGMPYVVCECAEERPAPRQRLSRRCPQI